MNLRMNKWLNNLSFRGFAILSIVLAVFALFYHLGYHAFIGDECIRSLVAFEMLQSGNYIVPTINGGFYYYKPPLYNWFIALSFYLFESTGEFAARTPTVLFSLLFTYAIYYINKEHFGRKFGFISALLFLTCGRILFWDSMLGLIDIGFSLLTFVQISLVYYLFKREKILQLFIFTYILTALGFLMKGYPSLVFQAISVGSWFIYNKRFKVLFSIKHILGILILASIVGSYYYVYSQYNTIENTFAPLLDQAVRRTAVRFSIFDVIKHLITYPFENIFHFLPWSLLGIILLQKNTFKIIKSNSFLSFNALMFLANIAVYWASPEVYPRYILMLIPFIFTVLLYFYFNESKDTIAGSILDKTYKTLVVLLPFAAIGLLWIPSSSEVSYYGIKVILLFIALSSLSYLYFKRKDLNLLIFIIMMIVVRIGFDIFVLHDRKHYSSKTFYKDEAVRIGNLMKDKDLQIYKNSRVHFIDSYYIMNVRNKTTKRVFEDFRNDQYYILDPMKFDINQFEKVDSFQTWEFDRKLYIMQIK